MYAFPILSGHLMSMTPEQLQAWRWEREIDERNRPLTDDELDAMFPEGYKVHTPTPQHNGEMELNRHLSHQMQYLYEVIEGSS